jgi:hypothetical protein
METESRRWFLKCTECSFEKSYWDLGGIRWKARQPENLEELPELRRKILASDLQKRGK